MRVAKDHHAVEGARELERIRACRAKAPRAAALIDEIAPAVESGTASLHVEVVWFYLDSRISRGVDITETEERMTRDVIEMGSRKEAPVGY